MINVSEVTGAWTIPFGIDLGNTMWDLINHTGLFTIPFVISIGSCWFKARAGGEDDGSAAVMFFKLLEKSWLTMFFCLLVFVIPVNESSSVPDSYTTAGGTTSFSPINFKAYSCRGDFSSILPPDSTSSNIDPNLPFAQTLNTSLPLFFGLSNQMFQGYTQSLNAMIPCDTNMNAAFLMADTAAFSANGDDKVEYSTKQFMNYCVSPATQNLDKAISNNFYNNGKPLNEVERRFNSDEMIAAYSGVVPKTLTESYSILYMPYDSTQWAGTGGGDSITTTSEVNGDANEDKQLSCSSAQTQMLSVIAGSGGVFDTHYSEEMIKAKTTEQAYPDKTGAYTSDIDITTKYANQFIMDISGNVAAVMDINHSSNQQVQQKREESLFGDVVARTTTLMSELSNHIANYTLSLAGGVLVSALIAILFASSPIILTLSGYSFKVASALTYTLAFLIGTSYVLDLGWYIENVILTLVTSSYSIYATDPVALNGDVPIDMLGMMSFIQSSVVTVLLGVWSLLGGLLGVMVIPAFSQALNSFSSSVGDHGAKVAVAAIKMVGKIVAAL